MTPNRTVRHLTRGGIALAQHPLAVVAYAAGVVKGIVEGTVQVTESVVGSLLHPQRGPHPAESAAGSPAEPPAESLAESSAGPEPTEVAAEPAPGERTLYGGLNTEAAPPMTPGGGGEPIEHEPHAESRTADHGGAVDPREAESWQDEALDDDVTEPAELAEADDEPLLDPAVAKAVRSESEILQRAADPDKG